MIKLKLKKSLSYRGIVSATKQSPFVFVEDNETAEKAVATGYFEIVSLDEKEPVAEVPNGTLTTADVMNVTQLKAYAKKHGIDLGGATKKDDIVAAIRFAETGEGTGLFDDEDNE